MNTMDRYSGSNDDAPERCDDRCPGCVDCREPTCEICGVGGDLVEMSCRVMGWTTKLPLCRDCAALEVGVIDEYSTATTDDAAPIDEVEGDTTPLPRQSMQALVFGGAA